LEAINALILEGNIKARDELAEIGVDGI